MYSAINDKSGYPPATYHYIYKSLVVKSDYFTLRALTLSLQITAINTKLLKIVDLNVFFWFVISQTRWGLNEAYRIIWLILFMVRS